MDFEVGEGHFIGQVFRDAADLVRYGVPCGIQAHSGGDRNLKQVNGVGQVVADAVASLLAPHVYDQIGEEEEDASA